MIFNIDISPCMYLVCVHGECILCVCMVFVTCVCLVYTWSCEFMFVLGDVLCLCACLVVHGVCTVCVHGECGLCV